MYGVRVSIEDLQTGSQIALSAIALALAAQFLRVPLDVWAGMAVGFVLGAVWYWWSDTYHQVVPADRLFEFVKSSIWCSVATGFIVFAASTLIRRANAR
jgi:hypothetical protein